jgi:hypothetical protein
VALGELEITGVDVIGLTDGGATAAGVTVLLPGDVVGGLVVVFAALQPAIKKAQIAKIANGNRHFFIFTPLLF